MVTTLAVGAACGGGGGGGGGGGADAPADDGTGTGPAATLKCTSSGKNAFETYGTAFVAVNEQIFTNVENVLAGSGATDGSGELGSSFGEIGVDGHDGLAAFKGNLAATLVYGYGGPFKTTYTDGVTYDGSGGVANLLSGAEHTGFEITDDQYNAFLGDVVVAALTDKGVPSGDVSSCFAPLLTGSAGSLGATVEASVVGK